MSEARPPRLDAAALVGLFGAILLFVSPFLTWFDPGGSAWEAFEVLDVLVLAIAAYAAVVATSRLLAVETTAPRHALLLTGGTALVLVLATISSPPALYVDADLASGAWLAFVGSAILVIAGGFEVARLSISLSVATQREPDPAQRQPADASAPGSGGSDDGPGAEPAPAPDRTPSLFRPERPTMPAVAPEPTVEPDLPTPEDDR